MVDMKSEAEAAKKKRAGVILKHLTKTYPSAKIALQFKNSVQLLVAVILSAQCTDKKVNEVTTELFKKYKTAKDFAEADPKTFEKEIKPTGFYHTKAKSIITTAKMLVEKYGGALPKTMKDMLTLRGVARKTANIVLGNAYGVVEGIAVDTHVGRVSGRLGLTRYHDIKKIIEPKKYDPNKVEEDLMKLYPKKEWFGLTYKIIEHGRAICKAPNPNCAACPLNDSCPSAFTFKKG